VLIIHPGLSFETNIELMQLQLHQSDQWTDEIPKLKFPRGGVAPDQNGEMDQDRGNEN